MLYRDRLPKFRFQSTLPRGERLELLLHQLLLIQFQSTLPRGERPNIAIIRQIILVFQSTLPRGERHAHKKSMHYWKDISIHAPTRGATYIPAILILRIKFQSTLPRGERQDCFRWPMSFRQFQSTLPRGERPFLLPVFLLLVNFNPRSHEGSDITEM